MSSTAARELQALKSELEEIRSEADDDNARRKKVIVHEDRLYLLLCLVVWSFYMLFMWSVEYSVRG